MDYIKHRCSDFKECASTLQKKGKVWELAFPFQQTVELNKTDIYNQTVIGVDLGINNSCTCCVMRSDGTVAGRYFYKLPEEYDCLKRKINRIKFAQHHGPRRISNLWTYANGVNDDIAVKTAGFIMSVGISHNADVVVFEHLDFYGKKYGSKKQRLHLWKAKRVQELITQKAHKLGVRISHICAWGTSRLAFDGCGYVKRGNDSEKKRFI